MLLTSRATYEPRLQLPLGSTVLIIFETRRIGKLGELSSKRCQHPEIDPITFSIVISHHLPRIKYTLSPSNVMQNHDNCKMEL